jgi:GH3 auxin-responsive promoter
MSFLQWMAGSTPVRRVADAFFRKYARRRVARLDGLDSGCSQRDTLLALVHQAQATRFGREHGFDRIRTVAEYQRQVPLRDYEAFWKEYWQPAYPAFQGTTWPEHVPYVALSSGTTSGTTKYIPVSRAMLASNRKAALTTLSFFLAQQPEAGVFCGRIFFLGGSTSLSQLAAKPASRSILAGDLSGIAALEVSSLLRPYTFPPLDLALGSDWDHKVQALAEHSARLPITVLSGVPSWILVLFDRLKRVTGKERIADIWPALRLVIHGGTKFDAYRPLFRKEIGSDSVSLLETYPCSEGFVATEDPRHELLRVIPDHGIFFEFVPVDELRKDRPTRHTLADVEPGVQYTVALTSCAGLWSYLVGDTVCFERRDPPLLRFTGRTKYYLSAFGEHLISEEVERALAEAAAGCDALVTDFHVGPVFPEGASVTGHHRYLVEFAQPPIDLQRFAGELDAALGRLNEDYRAHRDGSLSLGAPEILPLPRGAFADWMRSKGKLGGQHKVPRMDNTGAITGELSRWAQEHCPVLTGSPA